MARFNPDNPYLGRRGPSALRGRTSTRFGGSRGLPGMERMPGVRKITAAPGSDQAVHAKLMAASDAAMNEGDEDNATPFARGGVVLRQKQPNWKGISRTRASVDTADAYLRGSDTVQEHFDRRGRPGRSPATAPVGKGGKED
jgi:hypothetical protein